MAALSDLYNLHDSDPGWTGGTGSWEGAADTLFADSDGNPRDRAGRTEAFPRAAGTAHVPPGDGPQASFLTNLSGNSASAAILLAAALVAVVVGVARCAWQTVALRRRLARCSAIKDGPGRRLLDELC